MTAKRILTSKTSEMIYQAAIPEVTSFLEVMINENTKDEEKAWIHDHKERCANNPAFNSLFLIFSSASRFVSKAPIAISEAQSHQARHIRNGFQPDTWNVLECVRVYFLLKLPHENDTQFEASLRKLFEMSDLNEQIALYKALPLLPFPHKLVKQATEGLRTNITDVFDAIALNNPFPGDFLNQRAWNQMVLKAVFMQRPLYQIYDSDKRINSELADILLDFAHERWAANRTVQPELWQFVGPYLTDANIQDIRKVLQGSSLEKEAGLLACSESKLPEAQNFLNDYPEIKQGIESGAINWTAIGKKSKEQPSGKS